MPIIDDPGAELEGWDATRRTLVHFRVHQVCTLVRFPVHQVCTLVHFLGWRFRIRTDSVEGRIRGDSVQPRRRIFCGIVQPVWAFRPYRNGFRIRTDAVESRIRTDSEGFRPLSSSLALAASSAATSIKIDANVKRD